MSQADDDHYHGNDNQYEKDSYINLLEDILPDDANYKHKIDSIEFFINLCKDLPDGWKRNDRSDSNITAPYIHENSGKVSWKHPNQKRIREYIDKKDSNDDDYKNKITMQQMSSSTTNKRSQIKKLRIMIQSGVPLPAVEQKAKLDGINMSLVLENNNDNKDDNDNNKSDCNSSIIPIPLLKKYKRMIKSGVPLPAVQQLAYTEGGYTPEQIVQALTIKHEENNQQEYYYSTPPVLKKSKTTSSTDFTKYIRMKQSGVPFGAIQQTAKLDGIGLEQLTVALNNNNNNNNDDTTTTTHVEYFSVLPDDKISFPASTDLAALVQKMAHTIHKRASSYASNDDSSTAPSTIVVTNGTLYNALGALQGVQYARYRYNSTLSYNTICGKNNEAKFKRQPFTEIARTIGMALPSNFSTPVEITGLDELVSYIQKLCDKELNDIKVQIKDGWYDFDSLAFLYTPGSKVVAKNAGGGGVDMICQVAWNRYEQGRTIMGQQMKYFKVCFQYIVAVGASHATIAEVVEGMEYFEGRRKIHTGLNFIPLTAFTVDDQMSLIDMYSRRGRLYNHIALNGKHAYMSYQKGCFFLKRSGNAISGSINNPSAALATGGRVIVDTQRAYDHGHTISVGYDPMVTGIKYKYKEYSLHLRSIHQQGKKSNGSKTTDDCSDGGLILLDQVPDDCLDMVWPLVVGFSLTAKSWGDILVDGLEEITFSNDIFDRLVLPDTRKRMVKALVRHSTTSSFHDLIDGKGEGTVFLLYGPPGVGKTLTAEAVAELLHKPLYSLSMGALGTNPEELEQRLGEIMNLCSKWDALILLDEADSFLETRSSTSSLQRNAMVSVMLKLVEYFSGILFLTSNRIDSLDPAFQTRITLALRYEDLDMEAREQVWINLLYKSGFQTAVTDGTIDVATLAKSVLNGREIKNALRLAMAMATEEGKPLSQDFLLDTVDIVNDYKTDKYQTKYDGQGKKGSWWFSWLN